ncbi:DNA-binding response regulator [Adhaeribacter arboris]|uniref:DNA-binding response regulator n=1 Tax=Adhaeribacter arboris TaxID=2072846 RepID=A0A2T2YM35_9BACT|nr:response regulator [Adhaeribacter arboris]PSR56572.1 DNA-binding response regulator [Adhaeribacter arboris]
MAEGNVRILIVEDEGILAMGLEDALMTDGYEVVGIADNGPEAITLLKENSVDLVLLDIHIKGDWDGIETAKHIRALKDIPFIYLTAFADEATVNRAKDTFPAAYLTKPYQQTNLRIAIEMALHQFAFRKENNAKVIPLHKPGEKDKMAPSAETILAINDAIFVKQNYRFLKIVLADILVLEADSNFTYIYTLENKFILRCSLQHVVEKISLPQLVRVHRSFAVNLQHLQTFNDSFVVIGKHEVPLGRNYKEEFFKHFNFL